MKALEEKILAQGKGIYPDIIQVGNFINHQVDPAFMNEIGEDIAKEFVKEAITKVVTIESSGIAPALMCAYKLGVPLIILKKKASKNLSPNVTRTEVTSFTKGDVYDLSIADGLIDENDHVLIVDDFLANGEAGTGAIRLIRKCHATIAGFAALVRNGNQGTSSPCQRCTKARSAEPPQSMLLSHLSFLVKGIFPVFSDFSALSN